MKHTRLIILTLTALAAFASASAEPVAVRLPGDAVALVNALTALDGVDHVLPATDGAPAKSVRTPYDFGKDSVRIRLTIRANLIALRNAYDAFEQSRTGYVKEIFGVESLTKEVLLKQPVEKQVKFTAKVLPLFEPTKLELTLLTEEDVTTLAAAGVPGSVSAALEPLIAKPAKK